MATKLHFFLKTERESAKLFTLSYRIDALAQQLDNIVSRDLGKHVGILQKGISHRTFVLEQTDNFLLDGAGCNEYVGLDALQVADIDVRLHRKSPHSSLDGEVMTVCGQAPQPFERTEAEIAEPAATEHYLESEDR